LFARVDKGRNPRKQAHGWVSPLDFALRSTPPTIFRSKLRGIRPKAIQHSIIYNNDKYRWRFIEVMPRSIISGLKFCTCIKNGTKKRHKVETLCRSIFSSTVIAQALISTITIFLFTRSRISLPGLKCGTYFAPRATESPVFGLRPVRGGR